MQGARLAIPRALLTLLPCHGTGEPITTICRPRQKWVMTPPPSWNFFEKIESMEKKKPGAGEVFATI